MATLTYDPTPADQPEFNEAEQEALAIGEAQAEAESQMLAGKFKDAEALEQAYIELQKKLGESNDEDGSKSSEEGVRDEAPTEEVEEEEEHEIDQRLLDASEEWNTTGKLSDETISELSQMDSSELINAYLQAQGEPSADLSDQQVAEIQQDVGGAEGYQQIVQWASENLPQEFIESYDRLVEYGDPMTIRLALAGLQSVFQENNGYEGQMLTGKAAQQQQDVFRSQAEVVEAMSDPRYDRDPAYRNDVFEKLNRSDIQY